MDVSFYPCLYRKIFQTQKQIDEKLDMTSIVSNVILTQNIHKTFFPGMVKTGRALSSLNMWKLMSSQVSSCSVSVQVLHGLIQQRKSQYDYSVCYRIIVSSFKSISPVLQSYITPCGTLIPPSLDHKQKVKDRET